MLAKGERMEMNKVTPKKERGGRTSTVLATMDKDYTIAEIKKIATDVLELSAQRGKQFVDIALVAEALGFKTKETRFNPPVLGMVVHDKDEKCLYSNSTYGKEKQQLAIARGIARVSLYGTSGETHYIDFDGKEKIVKDDFELNNFAAILLMPTEAVLDEWHRSFSIDAVASSFKVPPSLVATRLWGLGLMD